MMGTTKIHQLQIPISGYYTGGDVAGVGSCLQLQTEHQAAAINQFIFDYNGKKEFTYSPNGGTSATTNTQ